MGHVRDLWTDAAPGGVGRRPRNARWGRGKRWQARWEERGVERSRAFVTKDEATTFVAQRMVGTPVRTASATTFAVMAQTWQAAQVHHRASTARTAASALNTLILPTLGDFTLAELDRATLQEAVGEWAATWSASRVRVAWSYVTSILTLAEQDGLIERRPTGVRLPRVETAQVVPLTAEQVQAIADAVPAWWRSMVVVGAATGLRSGELRGLTWDRVVGGVVVVDRQLVGVDRGAPVWGPPKTASSRRRLALGAIASDELEKVRGDSVGEDLVWRTRLGTPLTRTAASGVWRDAVSGMGLRDRSGWHELRHFHASMLIGSGLSVRAVADRLGHADPAETLRTYAHLWPTDDERAVAAVDAALSNLRSGGSDGIGR